LNIRNMA